MRDEMSLRADAARAARAQALLSDEMLTEAFTNLQGEYIKAWEITGALDTVARERLWQAVQVLTKIQAHLQTIVGGGKLAQREIDDLEGKKPKRFGIV